MFDAAAAHQAYMPDNPLNISFKIITLPGGKNLDSAQYF
jgi:hypothetical protein